MVNIRFPLIAVLLLAPSVTTAATTDAGVFTPDSLRKRLEQTQTDQETAANRLKASQADPKTLKLLTDREITFKLPNGVYVDGILLESGKVAPAIRRTTGLQPACVTSDFRLVPGEWHVDRKAIVCKLEQSETFALIENTAPQIAERAQEAAQSQSVSDTPTSTSEAGPQTKTTQGAANKYGPRERPAAQVAQDPASVASQSAHQVSTPSHGGSTSNRGRAYQTSGTATGLSSNLYIPPGRNAGAAKTSTGTLATGQRMFGISMGTWMRGSLTRQVSSAESGQIEFTLEESVLGKYRDLPAGTIFFSNKSFNSANKRLESVSVTALLPDGEEIQVQARIYGLDQTAGLTGVIQRDREGEFASISTKAALNTLSALTPEVDGAAGSAVSDVADGLINTEEKNVQRQPTAVITVSPQRCLLKIVKTF